MPLHLVQYSHDNNPNYRKQRVRTEGTAVGLEAVPEVVKVLKATHRTNVIDVATIRTLDPRPDDDRELPVPPAGYPDEITATPGYTESPANSGETDEQPEVEGEAEVEADSTEEQTSEPEPETKPTSARKRRRSRRSS